MGTPEQLGQLESELTTEQLASLLVRSGIDISTWGTGSAKTVENLLHEIQSGESQVSFDATAGIRRKVRVAWIDVLFLDAQDTIYQLIEDRQEYHDGRMRKRQLPSSLGEKFKPGENPEAAAVRALQEELSVTSFQSLYATGYKKERYTPDSYPGLATDYETHSFVAVLDAFGFNPDGYIETQTEKTNYYVWEVAHPANK